MNAMRSMPKLAMLGALFGAFEANVAAAQTLDNDARRVVTLDDGSSVTLIGAVAPEGRPREYFVLPNQLLNSRNSAGEPQFLFMAFTTDDRPEDGGGAGGVLHFLTEWGLTGAQEEELRAKLADLEPGAEYEGFVQLLPADDATGSFAITSAVLSGEDQGARLVTSGAAPLVSGGKAAVAARLDSNAAQLLYETFEGDSAVGDLSITMNFAYATQVQGPKGTITIDWNAIEAQSDRLEAEYTETHDWAEDRDRCWLFWKCDAPTVTYDYDETRTQFEMLIEEKLIDFEYDAGFPDERAAEIENAFIQYFISMMSDPTPPPVEREADGDGAENELPDIEKGEHYTFERTHVRTRIERRKEELSMDFDFQVKWPHQITGNLKDWQSFASDFEGLYQKVILDDPFFEWRDILFVVDLDSRELFEEQVNFVTVNVEKQREDGVWRDSVTIDEAYIAENGARASMTYSRGQDANSDLYRYQFQWAMRGGARFPENPPWRRGAWEGVTLAAPLEARSIDFEADVGELAASGFTRATAQIRYPRLGAEEEANIHLSTSRGEPRASERIYLDAGAQGYVYRLVLHHRRFGRLATDWSARLSDDYIYAVIPEELLVAQDEGEPPVVEARNAASTPQDDVLADFDALLGGD